MHEASLVQGLLKIALKTVEDHNAAHPEQQVRRIRSITCELHRRHFTCPHCGSDAIRFTGGHGLVMTNLEVEPEESHD